MREFELLNHIYAASARSRARPAHADRVLIGPGDDMGMVRLTGSAPQSLKAAAVLASVDQLIDGRHVRLATTPIELVGRKAITRSLSDIAAMAARPLASLVAAALPPDFGEERTNALFDAMRQTAEQYDCPLIGGDIAFHSKPSSPLTCSVTVLAEPGEHALVLRSGAKVGDVVYVTGALGGSLHSDGLGRHLTFEPRINIALELASLPALQLHSMIDISDGLGRDASHISDLSNVQIRLDACKVPCNPGCDWRRALSDGEDYELCFTATGSVPDRIGDVPITAVGEVLPRDERSKHSVIVIAGSRIVPGEELGWEHDSSQAGPRHSAGRGRPTE